MLNVEKVYTTLNADEVKPGSLGYFADDLETLERMISSGSTLKMLEKVNDKRAAARFKLLNENSYCLFYLVEQPSELNVQPSELNVQPSELNVQPSELNVQPYISGAALLSDFESKQHPLYVFNNDTKDCIMITRITITGVYLNSEFVPLSELTAHFSFKNGDPVGVKNDKRRRN